MSNLRNNLVKESHRIEEDTLFSGKRHYNAASRWRIYYYVLGGGSAISAAISGISVFNDYPDLAGILAIFTTILASLLTFLNPSKRTEKHRNSGGEYFKIKNDARIFRDIEMESTIDINNAKKKLLELSSRRDKLNKLSPETSKSDYLKAQKGIDSGENDYQVDIDS